MIGIVLDTNILISGIFWSGAPKRLVELLAKGHLQGFASPSIIEEYTDVFGRIQKKTGRDGSSDLYDSFLMGLEICDDVQTDHPISRDPDDDKFVLCAMASGCNLVISGDNDLLEIESWGDVVILAASDFLSRCIKFP
jgi:putative PIN family toxin of toxin-antitoxin system